MHISASGIFSTTALATVLFAQSAMADVSARDVWTHLQEYLTRSGYDIDAKDAQNGDTLLVSDMVITVPLPEEEGALIIDYGAMSLVENGDGTVSIKLPEEKLMSISSSGHEEGFAVKLSLRSDESMLVEGAPEAMTYTYGASEAALRVVELTINDRVIEDVDIAMVLAGLSGSSEVRLGETLESRAISAIDSLTMTIAAQEPEGEAAINATFSLTGMKTEADSVLPDVDYANDPAALFTSAFSAVVGYTYEGMTGEVSYNDGRAPGEFGFTSGPGDFALDMNSARIFYEGKATETQLKGVGGDLPLPVDVSFGEVSYLFDIPLSASEEEQDFGLKFVLGDLEISELLWSLFDPTQALPRDPATLAFDLVGKGTILTDLFTLDENTTEAPGALNSLTLNDFRLMLAGASLTGTGSFAFDNSDLESFDGLPRPEGALDLRITGVNGLMDTLVSMGLLPEEQALAARFMMGTFTQRGEGEDTLTSKIEVNDKGHVLANGQRLK